ncbi:MAG: ABC transporter permease [Clostridia bacterium]|nr:ABC transporter permease [Clostridia bacterium]
MEKTKKSGSVLGKIWSQYSFIFVFIAIFAVYALVSSSLTWSGVMNIFRHTAVVGTLALGMGLICITGEIDLSIGSMLALIGGLSVMVFNVTGSIIATLLFTLASGAVFGLVNGFLVGVVEMPAFIVTLSTMLIYRSASQYICKLVPKDLIGNGSSVYKMNQGEGFKEAYNSLFGFGNGKFFTVPVVGILLIIVTIIFVYVSSSTKFGKKVYAIGSNKKAAGMAGINVQLNKTLVFVIAGVLTGLGAFIWIAMNGSCDPATTGKSYEMYAIAAVVLGGISMSGGKGKVVGIIFGAMSYTVIDKIIVALKMDSLIQDAIKGVILVIVILIQVAGPKLKESRLFVKYFKK